MADFANVRIDDLDNVDNVFSDQNNINDENDSDDDAHEDEVNYKLLVKAWMNEVKIST